MPRIHTGLKPARLQCAPLEDRIVPTFYGNQLFPLDNPWNQNVAAAPVATNSNAIITRIVNRHSGTAPRIHADFGNPSTDGALWGIPITVVDGTTTPAVSVYIPPNDGYPSESDIVQIPIPINAVIEGDGPTGPALSTDRGDSHLLIYDRTANVLYELYQALRPNETQFPYGGTKPVGQWGAYQISKWNLGTNSFRTVGWTSADAAGLPILPGLVRPDEVLPASAGGAGVIDHAIRMTVVQTLGSFVYPASHEASSYTSSDLPRMGERFRLKASFVIPSTWSPEAKAIAQAMKTYGLIVADNGSDMYFTGTPSTQWNMSAVLQVQSIRATDFDVVDLTPAITSLSATSGPLAGGTTITITGRNFAGAAGRMHVLFGTSAAASFTIVSDSQIVAEAPAHAAGTVDVRVQSGQNETNGDGAQVFFGYGTSANTNADDFTFSSSSPPVPPAPPSPPVPPPPSPPSPPVPPPPTTSHFVTSREFAVGADHGGNATVRFFNPNGTERFTRTAFENFTGGVRVAAADFNGDGIADVVVGTGPGGPTQVRILDGTDGHELFAIAPFEATFTGGVYVSGGDLTGDGISDLVISPDEGGGPRVEVFRGGDYALVANFFGIDDKNFRGGARTAIGDTNGDGTGDLVISAGFGGGPRIAVYDGRLLTTTRAKLLSDFFLFESGLRNGAFVAAGDVNGDGFADIIGGGGPGGAPRVFALSGKDMIAGKSTVLANFFAGSTSGRGGVRVSAKNLDDDSKTDILTGDGAGSGSRVNAYLGKDFAGSGGSMAFAFDAYPGFVGGVFVG